MRGRTLGRNERDGGGRMVDLMWTGAGGAKLIEKYMEEGVERKKDRDIQGDWIKVDKSTVWLMYKEIKKEFKKIGKIAMSEYWQDGYKGVQKLRMWVVWGRGKFEAHLKLCRSV